MKENGRWDIHTRRELEEPGAKEGGKGKGLEKKKKEFCTRGWAAQVKRFQPQRGYGVHT